jgi:hypothetical protein
MGETVDTDAARGLLGLFLADGRLERIRAPVRSRIRAVFEGGVGETDFLEEKVAEFRRFIPTRSSIGHYQTSQREGGGRTTVLRFRAQSQQLRPIYNLLYPYGSRQITPPALGIARRAGGGLALGGSGQAAARWWLCAAAGRRRAGGGAAAGQLAAHAHGRQAGVA